MGTYQENYKLIDWSKPIVIERKERLPAQRSDLPCPMISSDDMPAVQSQLDGKMYSSKSALRATYRAAGMIEVGNDPARLRPRERPKVDRRVIKDTVERAVARFNRGERAK